MRRLVIVIMAVVLMAGCKVSKEASTVSEVKTETKVDVLEVVASESKTNTVVHTTVNYNDSEAVDEIILVTEYSQPDTAGRQYVLKTTAINRSKTKHNKLSKVDAVKQEVEAKATANRIDKSTQKIKENTKQEAKTSTCTKTPGWLYVVVGLVMVALFVFCYLILKRNKII